MNIFSTRPGRVVRLPDDNNGQLVLPIQLEGWGGTSVMKSVITKIGIHEQVSAQFLNTLQNYIYVYVFGDQPSQLTIGGYCFAETCDPGITSGLGLDKVSEYYQINKASSRPSAVLMVFGRNTAFRGFLIDMQIESADPATSLCQFSFSFVSPPRSAAR